VSRRICSWYSASLVVVSAVASFSLSSSSLTRAARRSRNARWAARFWAFRFYQRLRIHTERGGESSTYGWWCISCRFSPRLSLISTSPSLHRCSAERQTFGRGGTTHSLCVTIPGFSEAACRVGEALGARVGHGLPMEDTGAGEAMAAARKSETLDVSVE